MRRLKMRHAPATGRDKAYVMPFIGVVAERYRELAVGVVSPAYKNAPRGVRMTLRQAERFARLILRKVEDARAFNEEVEIIRRLSENHCVPFRRASHPTRRRGK